ncbi:MAG: glutathione S-transferase family protein [Chloroflexota bacterium]
MITLHHLEYSQSFRVLWLLEELGVEYALKKYDRDPKTHLAPDDYKAISPLKSAPVITEGDFALAETSAIMDYLLDRYPNDVLRPTPDSPDRTRHLFWYHTAQGSIMPLMLMESIFLIIQKRVPSILNLIIRPVLARVTDGFIQPRMEALLTLAEKDLATKEWFGGDNLTIADMILSYPMESASVRGYITDAYPNCQAWLQRIYASASFQSAKEKDGRPSMILPL